MALMNREISPSSIAPPAANYALAVLSEGPARLLHTSGVIGAAPDGSVPDGIAEQAEIIWTSIAALLAEAGMQTTDIVSMITYVVADELDSLASVMAARDRGLGGHRVSSTLVTVPALARPAWKVEIAVVAAQ
jgi:2-iminobutanoate/2-iminopropanoate deaminase